jgi:hypothetical protein
VVARTIFTNGTKQEQKLIESARIGESGFVLHRIWGDMCGEATRAEGNGAIGGKILLLAFMNITKCLILLPNWQNRFICERDVNAAPPKFFQALASRVLASGRFGAARLR